MAYLPRIKKRENDKKIIDKYPEVKTFGPLVPAYGVWARHVKGLKLVPLKFNLKNNDLRPAFVIDDGKEAEITNCKIAETSGAQSIISLENVEGARISKLEVKGSAEAFVRVEGSNSKDVRVMKNKIPGIKKEVELANDVEPGVAVHN